MKRKRGGLASQASPSFPRTSRLENQDLDIPSSPASASSSQSEYREVVALDLKAIPRRKSKRAKCTIKTESISPSSIPSDSSSTATRKRRPSRESITRLESQKSDSSVPDILQDSFIDNSSLPIETLLAEHQLKSALEAEAKRSTPWLPSTHKFLQSTLSTSNQTFQHLVGKTVSLVGSVLASSTAFLSRKRHKPTPLQAAESSKVEVAAIETPLVESTLVESFETAVIESPIVGSSIAESPKIESSVAESSIVQSPVVEPTIDNPSVVEPTIIKPSAAIAESSTIESEPNSSDTLPIQSSSIQDVPPSMDSTIDLPVVESKNPPPQSPSPARNIKPPSPEKSLIQTPSPKKVLIKEPSPNIPSIKTPPPTKESPILLSHAAMVQPTLQSNVEESDDDVVLISDSSPTLLATPLHRPLSSTLHTPLAQMTPSFGSLFDAKHFASADRALGRQFSPDLPSSSSSILARRSSDTPSLSSTIHSNMSQVRRQNQMKSSSRKSGFSLVDKMNQKGRGMALLNEAKKYLPEFEDARAKGFKSSESDFKSLVDYQLALYRTRQYEIETPVPKPMNQKKPAEEKPKVEQESKKEQQDTWMTDLRLKIERIIAGASVSSLPPAKPPSTLETPAYDKILKKEKDLAQQIEQLMIRKEEPKEPLKKKRDSFPPLTSDQLKKVEQLLAPGQGTVVSKFNVDLQKRDIRTLCDGQWLNDEVINFYGYLIMERSQQHPDTFPCLHYFNTFFYTTLKDQGYERFDLFQKQLVIVPVHLGMHWCCSIINFKLKRFEYYDSLHGPAGPVFKLLRNYLQRESLDKKKVEYDVSEWTDYYPKPTIPHQENGFDCGVFTCMFAEWISRGDEGDDLDHAFGFAQKHMKYLRKRMVLEIVDCKLMISQ